MSRFPHSADELLTRQIIVGGVQGVIAPWPTAAASPLDPLEGESCASRLVACSQLKAWSEIGRSLIVWSRKARTDTEDIVDAISGERILIEREKSSIGFVTLKSVNAPPPRIGAQGRLKPVGHSYDRWCGLDAHAYLSALLLGLGQRNLEFRGDYLGRLGRDGLRRYGFTMRYFLSKFDYRYFDRETMPISDDARVVIPVRLEVRDPDDRPIHRVALSGWKDAGGRSIDNFLLSCAARSATRLLPEELQQEGVQSRACVVIDKCFQVAGVTRAMSTVSACIAGAVLPEIQVGRIRAFVAGGLSETTILPWAQNGLFRACHLTRSAKERLDDEAGSLLRWSEKNAFTRRLLAAMSAGELALRREFLVANRPQMQLPFGGVAGTALGGVPSADSQGHKAGPSLGLARAL